MTKVLIFGANGMLGRALLKHLESTEFEVLATTRTGINGTLIFDAEMHHPETALESLEPGDFVLNAIGLISHLIDEENTRDRLQAIAVNAVFPLNLARDAEERGLKVIQIGTDCVFDGRSGSYTEDDLHNATDVYGKTKSLGESESQAVMLLRSSIVGPEQGKNLSLFEWVRSQDSNASIEGYLDHYWNGVTTDAFSQVVLGILRSNLFTSGVHHLVPSTIVTKSELVRSIADKCGRTDIQVREVETERKIDRTLETLHPDLNSRLWAAAGFNKIPSVQQLIQEISIN